MGCSNPKTSDSALIWPGGWKLLAANVTQFQPGDEVFGVGAGGFAEYACASERCSDTETGQSLV